MADIADVFFNGGVTLKSRASEGRDPSLLEGYAECRRDYTTAEAVHYIRSCNPNPSPTQYNSAYDEFPKLMPTARMASLED